MPSPRRLFWSAAAGIAVLATAPVAKADLVATFTGVSPGQSTSVSLATPAGHSGTYSAGAMNFDVTGGSDAAKFADPFKAFCIELSQTISGGSKTFATGSPASVTQVVDKPTVVTRLKELFGKYYSETNTNEGAAAFQVAVWEIVYDSTFDVTDGNFRLTSANSKLTGEGAWQLNGDLTAWNTNFANKTVVALTSPNTQDQITLADKSIFPPSGNAVPAPAGVWLGLIGVAALFGRNRLNRTAA